MTDDQKRDCVVLIAHGSTDPRWTIPFEKLLEDLRREYGRSRVHLAFMERSRPSLLEVAAEIVEEGIGCFQLLPLFMSSGNHFASDLPMQVEQARSQFPGLEIRLLPPIGQNPEFFKFIHKIAKAYVD